MNKFGYPLNEIIYPIYVVEYYCTYCDATWFYENDGFDIEFTSVNPCDIIAVFTDELEARDYYKKYNCNQMMFWDPMDYSEDSPDIGVGYYQIVKYTDDWNDTGTIIEKSDKGMTARQMRNLFKKSGINLKELSIKRSKQNGA